MDIETRYIEFRQDGRKLVGTALAYGTEARLPWGRERIEAGAFGADVANADLILNAMHDRHRPLARTGGGGLLVRDTAEALTIEAELPATRDADDVLALVKAGVLRGLSIEFSPERERMDGDLRIIEAARLRGVGVVDRPAYRASVVAARAAGQRRRRKVWL